MTQASMTTPSRMPTTSRTSLDYLRCASTGAFTTLLLFGLCWIGAAAGFTSIHGFVTLFTDRPTASTAALLLGGITAFLAGALTGFLIAHCYNLAGRVFGR